MSFGYSGDLPFDDFGDEYDWSCWACNVGFWDGASMVLIDGEKYCEACAGEFIGPIEAREVAEEATPAAPEKG